VGTRELCGARRASEPTPGYAARDYGEKKMEQISGADLLGIRSHAAMADDYTTICRNNTDRLTQAYLALQVENVRLMRLIRDHVEASNNDDTAGDTFAALVAVTHNGHS